jgi:RNA polymerase sigma-70 factor (ECF subfamily)
MIDFKTLFREHGPWLIELATSLVRSRSDGEDVVQEAFLKAYRKRESFRGDARPHTWLRRIVVNEALNFRRKRRGLRLVSTEQDTLPSPAEGPEGALTRHERSEAVRQALALLPESQRVVLTLKELGGLTYQEIAKELGVPRGTVESRVIRGRTRLRQLLERHMHEPHEIGRQDA